MEFVDRVLSRHLSRCAFASSATQSLITLYTLNDRTLTSRHAANGSYCDCYRADGFFAPNQIMENRYNEVGGASFDFFQLLDASTPLRGTWWPGDPDSRRTPHAAFEPAWEMQLEVACKTLFASLRPSAIVVNVGHHLSRGHSSLLQTHTEATLAPLYERVARLLTSVTPRVLWVTSIANHELHQRGLRLEHRLAGEHFPHVFNTSEWLADLRGTAHFFDGNVHLQAHGNVALACGLMRRLHKGLIASTGARYACNEQSGTVGAQ